jgi:cell envelope opacity-associated protein A
MNIQYKQPNGQWEDSTSEQAGQLLDQAVAHSVSMATRFADRGLPADIAHVARITDHATALIELQAGRTLKIGQDWYDQIRVKPAPRAAYNVDTNTDAAKLAGSDY